VNTVSLWVAFFFWGATQLNSVGSITGTILRPNGQPAPDVRVVAVTAPNTDRPCATSVAFENLTQTDSNGRYRLDNISPGRYFVAAGPVAAQTYHPGTSAQSMASIVTITRESPTLSGMDFTVAAATPSALPAVYEGAVCCQHAGKLVMEDGSPVPDFPNLMRVGDVRSSSAFLNQRVGPVWKMNPSFGLNLPTNAMAEIVIEGLPPGYVLKSVVYGGKDFGLNPFMVDGKSPATLELTVGYEPISTLKKVRACGEVGNVARELKLTSIRFISTIPNGPVLDAPLRSDGSFAFLNIPVGAYRVGVVDALGGANVSPNMLVIPENAPVLSIDLRDNPFPEFDGVRPERTVFTGERTEVTGVVTQQLTRPGNSDAAYFRMNVKDAATGGVTPWAVFVEHDWQVPRIIVGETLTVPGVPGADGTKRLIASPF
jgi:hypothetical protein